MSQRLIHVVMDYEPSGLEFGEIIQQLHNGLDDGDDFLIWPTSVPSLDTMAVGFVTAQYALGAKAGTIIYGNAAPRRDKNAAQHDNVGEGIKYARLDNGVEVINVYSEFAFGFMKDRIVEFRDIDCPNSGSQFRSRDFFPEIVARLANGDQSFLASELNKEEIPDIPANLVAWTDGFGNIKTTTRKSDISDFQPGDKVQVILNDVSMVGVMSIGGFQVDRGVLAINAGSSGYDNPFIELFLRVHHMHEKTAAVRFGYPAGGTAFELKRME